MAENQSAGKVKKGLIVTGMRPTGKLHLGHYIGVLKNMVKLQDEYECFFIVADWHALTKKFDSTQDLSGNTTDIGLEWLAAGIDPAKCSIYIQSHLPQTAELHVYLSMITPQNWVERDPTLKDLVKMIKTPDGDSKPNVSYGFLGYPVLMSADILTFNVDFVPVGIDQVAHIEITRDIARRFNNIYKTELFKEAKPLLTNIPMLKGVDGQKMGKSFHNDIKISDDDETTTKTIMKAITDRSRARKDDPGHPDKCEVAFEYWKAFATEEKIKQVQEECIAGKRGCADCKRELAALINDYLRPIRERRKYYEQHPELVKEIIRQGDEKARAKAEEVLKQVRKTVGMYQE